MRSKYYFIFLLTFFSCTINRYYHIKDKSILEDYSEMELNIISALTYIQYKERSCPDSCTIRVSGTFEYYDNCLMVWDSTYFKELGFDFDKILRLNQRNYNISDFGVVFFTNPRDSLDYYFSPVVVNMNRKSIVGQVKNKNGQKFSYGINVLGDNFYVSYEEGYLSDNCW